MISALQTRYGFFDYIMFCLIFVADIAALVELVGQLPKSHETINVSTVSKHCPENMLVFRSLFGLSQKAIPKRAVFHAIHRPSVWQSVHIVKEPKSILGGNYVNWLRSGRTFLGML